MTGVKLRACVLLLIGWESGANFAGQSERKCKPKAKGIHLLCSLESLSKQHFHVVLLMMLYTVAPHFKSTDERCFQFCFISNLNWCSPLFTLAIDYTRYFRLALFIQLCMVLLASDFVATVMSRLPLVISSNKTCSIHSEDTISKTKTAILKH